MIRFRAAVQDDWIDYNGHLRDAFYGLVFSHAIDDFMGGIGLDAAYRQATSGTLYVVEDRRRFLAEVHRGAGLEVATGVIALDDRRLHLWQEMTSDGRLRAECETIALHVSQAGAAPAVVPMPQAVQTRVATHRISGKTPLLAFRRKGE